MLDLFSGIGGFSYAASQFGIEICGFAEIDPFCSEVLFKHWPDVINYGDVKNIHFHKHVYLITGGFPCQPFSIAGQKKGNKDDRYLWPEFFRIIRESKPTWVIAENVPNIIDMELDRIIDDLESEGYETRSFCIPACAIGALHKRERLWIIANTNSKSGEQANTYAKPKQNKRHTWMGFAGQTRTNWNEFFSNTISFMREERTADIKTSTQRSEWQNNFSETRFDIQKFDWKESQPPIPGVDDGLPNIVDRNKALGNSIVPQIAFLLIGLIFNIETGNIDG